MAIGKLILRVVAENPSWTRQEVADEVRRRVRGAKTSAASVSSTVSRAGPATSARRDGSQPGSNTRRSAARYKAKAIGDAQNALVRNLLGRLGTHSFGPADWNGVRDEDFGGVCAYCGAVAPLEIEHAVPMNRAKMGEHHLGNLVPACSTCNRRKGDSDYVEFLAGQPGRIGIIEAHMTRRGYRPLCANGPLSELLESAHADVAALADRYARLLNEAAVTRG